ncbi:Protein kinase domain [Trypanosoma melophagium]|uniref:Protein kinase domain n=1 Tax=Trypanosoma melophagium TaxID=715481 RepID=UPI00351A2FA7|nr:Protein kinase domain [Trypanosoma melophagium]
MKKCSSNPQLTPVRVDQMNKEREDGGATLYSSVDAVEMVGPEPNPLLFSSALFSSSDQSSSVKKVSNSPKIKFINGREESMTASGEYKRDSRTNGNINSISNSGVTIISSDRETPFQSKEAPLEGPRVVKKGNCLICIVLLLFSLLLGVGGGIATGFVGYLYNMRNQRTALSITNSIVLSSAVGVLDVLQDGLKSDSLTLVHFADRIGTNFTSSTEMLEAYNESFFMYLTLMLGTKTGTDDYTIYVPFCSPDRVEGGTCYDAMLLSYTCRPFRAGKDRCYYTTARDNIVTVYEVHKSENGAVTGMSWIDSRSLTGKAVNVTGLVNNESSHYLERTVSTSADGSTHSVITFQRVVNRNNRFIVCETSSYTSNWFRGFYESLHKADISYAMIFASSGYILAYSYGRSVYPRGVPCRSINPDNVYPKTSFTPENCGTHGGEVLDSIVDLLVNSDSSSLPLPLLPGVGDAVVADHNGFVVAVQSFLKIWNEDANFQTFFAAYATPMATGLDEQGALQIIICVVIVVTSIIILGGVSLFSISQFQRTLELVSVLAVNVSTYNLDKMQEVLDRSQSDCSARFGFLASALLREEFTKILLNLKIYRPFLPQALLTNLSHGVRNCEQGGSETFEPPFGDDYYNMKNYTNSEGTSLPAQPPPELGFVERDTGYRDNTNGDSVEAIAGNWPLQRLKSVKGTVIVISLLDCIIKESGSVAIIDRFLAFVLHHVRVNGGVADHIGTDQVIATFNFHIPVMRHQQKACQCAMAIQEDCQKAELRVATAITSGANYVCTVGTDEQKARVVAGDSVDFAKQLVTLNPYLGVAILVTQAVAHAAGVVVVPVDHVEVFAPQGGAMARHVVFELVALHHTELSAERSLTREVLHLILGRQRERALQVVADFLHRHPNTAEVPWGARRLHELCVRNAALIEAGYARRAVQWAPLEGEAWLQRVYRQNKNNNAGTSTSADGVGGAGAGGSGSNRACDVERAKEKIDEMSHSSRRAVVMKAKSQGEDALISIFLKDGDASEEEENDTEEDQRLCVVQESFSRSSLPRCVEDFNQQIFYLTNELLGKGQFGEVYLAISSSGSFVATKVFPLEEDNGAALVCEVEALIQLRHEHILTYDTCAIQDGFFFIFTEYMAAGNMRKLIDRLGQVPEEAACKYSRDILYGLQFLHSMKYVHCDLKPDNVLLSSEGTCKLGDFGTVRLALSVADRVGTLRGTPRYMAPEAVLGNWTVKADIYSFGLTVAHMLLGCNPWSQCSEPDEHFLVRLAQNKGDMKPNLPTGLKNKELECAIHSCCEFEPSKRPTVNELLTLLS